MDSYRLYTIAVIIVLMLSIYIDKTIKHEEGIWIYNSGIHCFDSFYDLGRK